MFAKKLILVVVSVLPICSFGSGVSSVGAPPNAVPGYDLSASGGGTGTAGIFAPLKGVEVWCQTASTIRYSYVNGVSSEYARAYGKAGARVDDQGRRQVRAIYYYSTNHGSSWSAKDSGWLTTLDTGKIGYDGDRFAQSQWDTANFGAYGTAGISGGGSDDKHCYEGFPLN